jgi:hypothetical protein
MDKIYRIHVAPDEGRKAFNPDEDKEVLKSIVGKHFTTWLTHKGTRTVDSVVEELLTYTLFSFARRRKGDEGSLIDCVRAILQRFPNAFILIEKDGTAIDPRQHPEYTPVKRPNIPAQGSDI